MAGASAVLELTFLPTSVNFRNVHIIERDKGVFPPRLKVACYLHTIPILHQYALTTKTGYLTILEAKNSFRN